MIDEKILGNRNVCIYVVFILIELKRRVNKMSKREILTEAMKGSRLEVK